MVEDVVGGFDPGEGVAAVVPAVDEAADGCGEVFDAGEAAPADGLAGDDAEEDFDHVQPGPAGRGEVQGDPWVTGQPGTDRGMFVGAVVVAHQV